MTKSNIKLVAIIAAVVLLAIVFIGVYFPKQAPPPAFMPPSPDTASPVRSDGFPSGILPAGTTQTTLSLVTDENATCRYSAVANTAYFLLTDTFTTTSGTSHATLVSGLTDGTTYNYYVKCRDAADNVNEDDYNITFSVAQVSADTTPPSIPTNLTAVVISSSQINLSWHASTDNVGVGGYRIYRGGDSIATSGTTSYQNTGLSPSTSYSYTVATYDAAGNVSVQSSSATATTQSSPPPVSQKFDTTKYSNPESSFIVEIVNLIFEKLKISK